MLDILHDSSTKAKAKVLLLKQAIEADLNFAPILICELRALRVNQRVLGMEALELFTREVHDLDTQFIWEFAIQQLNEKSPAMLRESGRVIANLASRHWLSAEGAIPALLEMTEHNGTVVRWSAAHALSQIFLSDTQDVWQLNTIIGGIVLRDEKESIRKIYHKALVQKTKRKQS